MGFKRYLLWNDAVYGDSSNWINIDNCLSKDCIMVTISPIWTVKIISLLLF